MKNDKVKVYGAEWCSMTTHARKYLDNLGVAYDYVDVEEDTKASDWVKSVNGGKEKKPTIDICGQILSEPKDQELQAALKSCGLLQ